MSSPTRALRRATILLSSATALAGLALGGWYAVSPRYTLHTMQQAALQGDAEGFAAHVDFPMLRASMKSEIRARLEAEAAYAPPSSLRAIGIGLAIGFVDQMVESAVSPETVGVALAAMGEAGSWVSAPGLESLSLLAAPQLQIERTGLDRFRVDLPTDGERPALLFRRDGFSWKLDGVDLPQPQAGVPAA
jgi:hypothetical protein